MDAARWQRIDEVFAAALEQPAGQRRGFLDRACGDDAELRREVASLLLNHGDEAFLASGGADEAMQLLVAGDHASPVDPDVDDSASVRAGSYELLRRMGEGGMGVVYLAVRAERDFKNHVAIKVIRKGMDSEGVLARFRRERQILSSLDHPNIARLLDGGTTEDGRPYFVMEYVEGEPLIAYCDDKLSVNERLKLFGDVCSAVQYAHQNLVVHRDLKPGNVLVTAEGTVKLLDFGIAKLLDPDVSSVDVPPTATAIRLMTPEYASPEQARGDPVTTSTDVYSLGVILYELLVGRLPYQFATRNLVDICRVITEEQPRRPSTVVAKVLEAGTDRLSGQRGGSPQSLSRELRGDLDNIMLMALRKEPQRRYPSVEAFSEDIRRYLQGYPVHARQATWRYRSAKYVGRNKMAVTAVAAVFILLSGFSGLLALQNRRVSEQRDAAQRAEEKAVRVTAFLVDLFDTNDPARSKGEALTARQILDTGAQKLQREFQGSLEVRAELLNRVGTLYVKLGSYDRAEALLRESLAARRALHGREHLATAESLHDLGVVLLNKAAYEEAEHLMLQALAVRRKLLGDEHTDVARSTGRLAGIEMYQQRLDEAERHFRDALDIWRRVGTEHGDMAMDLSGLALVLGRKGDSEQEEKLYREALAMHRRLLGNEHPDVAADLNNLSAVFWERGQLQEAENLQREALALDRRLLGSEHPDLAVDLGNLAVLLRDQGQLDEAEKLQREALRIRRQGLGDEHADVALSHAGLAEVLLAKGQAQAAIELAGRALGIPEDRLPADSTTRARAKSVLGASLTAQRKYAQAEAPLLDAYRVWSARSRAGPHARTALLRIVRLYQAWGKPEKAAHYSALATGP
jgi:serine/threonine protein kinase